MPAVFVFPLEPEEQTPIALVFNTGYIMHNYTTLIVYGVNEEVGRKGNCRRRDSNPHSVFITVPCVFAVSVIIMVNQEGG